MVRNQATGFGPLALILCCRRKELCRQPSFSTDVDLRHAFLRRPVHQARMIGIANFARASKPIALAVLLQLGETYLCDAAFTDLSASQTIRARLDW